MKKKNSLNDESIEKQSTLRRKALLNKTVLKTFVFPSSKLFSDSSGYIPFSRTVKLPTIGGGAKFSEYAIPYEWSASGSAVEEGSIEEAETSVSAEPRTQLQLLQASSITQVYYALAFTSNCLLNANVRGDCLAKLVSRCTYRLMLNRAIQSKEKVATLEQKKERFNQGALHKLVTRALPLPSTTSDHPHSQVSQSKRFTLVAHNRIHGSKAFLQKFLTLRSSGNDKSSMSWTFEKRHHTELSDSEQPNTKITSDQRHLNNSISDLKTLSLTQLDYRNAPYEEIINDTAQRIDPIDRIFQTRLHQIGHPGVGGGKFHGSLRPTYIKPLIIQNAYPKDDNGNSGEYAHRQRMPAHSASGIPTSRVDEKLYVEKDIVFLRWRKVMDRSLSSTRIKDVSAFQTLKKLTNNIFERFDLPQLIQLESLKHQQWFQLSMIYKKKQGTGKSVYSRAIFPKERGFENSKVITLENDRRMFGKRQQPNLAYTEPEHFQRSNTQKGQSKSVKYRQPVQQLIAAMAQRSETHQQNQYESLQAIQQQLREVSHYHHRELQRLQQDMSELKNLLKQKRVQLTPRIKPPSLYGRL